MLVRSEVKFRVLNIMLRRVSYQMMRVGSGSSIGTGQCRVYCMNVK